MKKAVLDIHAYASTPGEHYHPWLQEQIHAAGGVIESPIFPGGITPDFDEWLEVAQEAFSKIKDSHPGKICVTGRSLGCLTAMKLAETNVMDTMVLVAPAFPIVFTQEKVREKFMAWKSESMPALDAFSSKEVDFEKVHKNCSKIVFFLSDTDPYVKPKLVLSIINQNFPDAEVKIFPNADHFKANAGEGSRSFSEFPELLEQLK